MAVTHSLTPLEIGNDGIWSYAGEPKEYLDSHGEAPQDVQWEMLVN
jgi:hypothetical protein